MLRVDQSIQKVCCESNSFRLVLMKDKSGYITGAKGSTFDVHSKVSLPYDDIEHVAIQNDQFVFSRGSKIYHGEVKEIDVAIINDNPLLNRPELVDIKTLSEPIEGLKGNVKLLTIALGNICIAVTEVDSNPGDQEHYVYTWTLGTAATEIPVIPVEIE